MFKILLIIVIFIIIFAWEIPKLIKKKEIKELLVFSFLGLIGFILSILVVMRGFI
jgi:Co/Zn/Cd efflux system component